MERSLKICSFLLVLFFVSSLTSLRVAHSQVAFYKYVDKKGNVHFTDRLDSIPAEYRNQIKVYKEKQKPQPSFSKEPAVKEEQDRQVSESGEKKEEEQKALPEKADLEKKLKERKDIQDRISSLEEQIRAKEEEKGPLLASGMVNDRLRLNQLNEEIVALVQEIRSLQRELSDKEER
jgi:hypothetical protein